MWVSVACMVIPSDRNSMRLQLTWNRLITGTVPNCVTLYSRLCLWKFTLLWENSRFVNIFNCSNIHFSPVTRVYLNSEDSF